MSHFKPHSTTSPFLTISIAYAYIGVIAIVLYLTGFYQNNDFFRWGTPINFFGQTIQSTSTFYAIHVLIFFHQLINNWVNTVVYPWIINEVQDPKTRYLGYSKALSLFLIALFDVYSELDVVFIIMGFASQISFVFSICVANLISSTYLNSKYLDNKVMRDLDEESILV